MYPDSASWPALLGEAALNRAAYGMLGEGRRSEAIALFEWITVLHPDSANARDSLAEACESAGDTAAAVVHSEKALALLEADRALDQAGRDRLRTILTERLERLKATKP